MNEIKQFSLHALEKEFEERNLPKFRARQIYKWLYQTGAQSYEEMTDLPKSLRAQLAEALPFHPAEVVDRQISKDGTRKYVIRFHDGRATEMVAIPARNRLTVCFSTQVGCAMECAFCATGREGFSRNLLPGEMVEQVLIAQRDMGKRVSNLVAMGQGEPFLNYENLVDALHILNGDKGLNIAARHITVSTCGLFEGIRRFGEEPEQFTLAVSLHSAIQSTRDMVMPRLSNQPLDELHAALEAYQLASGRRITFEYLMLGGLNDDNRHLNALLDFCKGLDCHVNLIPFNEIEGASYRAANHDRMDRFVFDLEKSGVSATLRESRGSDIAGACGQLKNSRKR